MWDKYLVITLLSIALLGAVAVLTIPIYPQHLSQKEADSLVENIRYVKDTRTSLCYAVAFRRLVLVPCDSIPELKK